MRCSCSVFCIPEVDMSPWKYKFHAPVTSYSFSLWAVIFLPHNLDLYQSWRRLTKPMENIVEGDNQHFLCCEPCTSRRGLNSLPNNKFLDWLKLKASADNKNKCGRKIEICFRKGRKHCGKRWKCWLSAFSPFPIMFSKLGLCGKELMHFCFAVYHSHHHIAMDSWNSFWPITIWIMKETGPLTYRSVYADCTAWTEWISS